jgi:hypothetical protein
MRISKIALATGLTVAALLIGLRIAAPYLLADYVNKNLQRLNDYSGHVESVHIALWRGAYALNNLVIVKKGTSNKEPFCSIEHLKLAIQWRALWHGAIVGEAIFEKPLLNLIQGENQAETQLGTDNNWAAALEKLFPFKFNQIAIRDGTVKFRAPGIASRDAVVLHAVDANIINLTNVIDTEQAAFAQFDLRGKMLGNAPLHLHGKTNPYASSPTFELDATLENVQIAQLNPWLQVYAAVNAEQGLFSMYSSFAAADRQFKGYVKPILHDIKIIGIKEDNNPFAKLWAALVQGVATLLKNQPNDQLATKIPFNGSIDDPDAGVLAAIVNVLRNAFVAAFSHSIDQSLHVQDVAPTASNGNKAQK